jgi:peptidoglycan hydrolase-like protein with peptidoglycan-binding domain
MLVIKTHYCLPFHRVAIIACLIAVTFGINLLVGLVSQNSFAQDIMDTNGDGVVDASDTTATTTDATNASSTEEIQIDTNGDGVVNELDTQTPATTTDATNASSTEEIQMDTNGDGVVDAQDEVAQTPTETPTEEIQMDTNGDGVVDAFDEMPDIFKPCHPNSPTLRIGKDGTVGSIGPKVKELQSHLTDLGYEKFLGPPGIDGKFGPYTEGAVKQFQIDMGLKGKDGIAGPETWAKICELLSLANKSKPLYVSQQYSCNPNSDTLEPDSENAKVIQLQTYLTDLGYGDLLEPEKIDGKFGLHTKNAVMAYQKDFGLSNDEKGIVGPQTWLSLCDQISLLPKTFPTNNTP